MPLKPWQIKSAIRLPLIPLSHGKFAIVDPDDYPYLSTYHWHARRSHSKWYAVRKVRTGRTSKVIFMHRQICQATCDQHVHHRNHNSLDNRRCNLIALSPREHDLLDRLDRLQLKNQANYSTKPGEPLRLT
jgi:hypothetical protein